MDERRGARGWRTLISGDWRVSAVLLAVVATMFAGPVVHLAGLRFPFAWITVAIAIIAVGTWWLVPERSQRRGGGSLRSG